MTIVQDSDESRPNLRKDAAARAPYLRPVGTTSPPARSFHSKTAQKQNFAGLYSSRSVGVSAAQSISPAALLIDGVVIVAASLISGISYHLLAMNQYGDLSVFAASGAIVAAIYGTILHVREGAQPLRTLRPFDLAKDASIAWIAAFALFLFVAFSLKVGDNLSRGAVLIFFVLGTIAATFSHIRVPFFLAYTRQTGAFEHRDVILIGGLGNTTLANLTNEIRASVCPNPTAITFDPYCTTADWVSELKKLIAQTLELARTAGRGEIIVVASGLAGDRLAGLLRGLNKIPRCVIVVPDDFTARLLMHRASAIGSNVGVEVQNEPFSATQRAVKRTADIVMASTALILLSPFFVVVAALIKVDSKGPILFKQARLGYRSQPFNILKFRTMNVLENGDDVAQAGKDDPRTTRVGRWLRKTSIDELPQLLNVLKGHMSLIGPRPHACAHDEKYAKLIENYELRQHVKPGITGWAQVHGLRGETKTIDLMYRRIEYDLWYVTNCSLALDAQILVRTAFEVLRQRNAY